MKKLTLSLFVLTSILFAISVQAQVGSEQARNYQIDETHTGSINSAELTPPLRPKWSRNFGQDMSYPLIAGGKVYVTVRNAGVFGTELYALNAADGATLWSYSLGGSSWCYLSYSCVNVNKLNPADGSLIWRDYIACSSGSGKAAAVYNGRVYARVPGSNADWIYDSQTGGLAGDFISKSAPAFAGNKGFFLNGNKVF